VIFQKLLKSEKIPLTNPTNQPKQSTIKNMKTTLKTTIASLVLTSLATCVASAAVVVSSSFQTGTHTYVVSSTDLINALPPTSSSGSFSIDGTSGATVLTNGVFPTSGGAGRFTAGGNAQGTSVTYTLPTAASIASIDVFGGWADGGRDQQSFSVLYATSIDPTIFLPLATVNFNPTPAPTGLVATQSTISENVTGILATDVKALRFNFNATENGWSGYAEFDVHEVPEPSAALLGGLGLLGLLIRRRK